MLSLVNNNIPDYGMNNAIKNFHVDIDIILSDMTKNINYCNYYSTCHHPRCHHSQSIEKKISNIKNKRTEIYNQIKMVLELAEVSGNKKQINGNRLRDESSFKKLCYIC